MSSHPQQRHQAGTGSLLGVLPQFLLGLFSLPCFHDHVFLPSYLGSHPGINSLDLRDIEPQSAECLWWNRYRCIVLEVWEAAHADVETEAARKILKCLGACAGGGTVLQGNLLCFVETL